MGCHCHDEHCKLADIQHKKSFSTEQKIMVGRIIFATIFLIIAVFLEKKIPQQDGILYYCLTLGIFLLPYLIIGYDIIKEAFENIFHGHLFDENFLMTVATIGAFALGDYPEAVFVMIFAQVGEFFEDYATDKSRASIAEMMNIRPDSANVERNGNIENISPEQVHVGDIVIVRPGEKIPLDGDVIEGTSTLDTSALTGESVPRDVSIGNSCISGCVNLSGLLKIRVTKEFEESTVSKILDLVENASNKKAKVENFITKFSKVYTPIVVFSAIALAILPPLLLGYSWSTWIHRALLFLVVSCPCALVISVPLSFFAGIGAASKQGILIKGSNYLETLTRLNTTVFDKTGTLTKGTFSVVAVHSDTKEKLDLLELAAIAESQSIHPISQSITNAWKTGLFTKDGALIVGNTITPLPRLLETSKLTSVTEIAGQGLIAEIDGKKIACGNGKLMDSIGAIWHDCHRIGTIIHIAINGTYEGHIVISDEIKAESKDAIITLKKLGIQKTVMLTGDLKAVGEDTAKKIGIDEVITELLPNDKVSAIEKYLTETRISNSKGTLAFVGDGINDAPVLTRADVGIAMGGLGSDAAIEAADVVLMDDNPIKIATAIIIARKTLAIVRENIGFALTIKACVLILGALGFVSMWAAVFADVGVSVIAIINAMRASKIKENRK